MDGRTLSRQEFRTKASGWHISMLVLDTRKYQVYKSVTLDD